MNALGAGTTYAVPDSAFPFSNELGGLADLLDPSVSFIRHSPLGDTKSATLQEDDGYLSTLPPFSMTEYGYYNWMSEEDTAAGLLPSPEEQDSDFLSFHPQSLPVSTYIPSLPTPDASAPATPTSSYQQDPELLDALSLIDGYSNSPDSSQYNPSTEVLPQFDVYSPLPSPPSPNSSPHAYSPYNPNTNSFLILSPSLSPNELNGYPLSVASESSSISTSPQNDPKTKSIVELLVEDTHVNVTTASDDTLNDVPLEVCSRPVGGSGVKRKRSEVEPDSEATGRRGGGKGKRRKLSKATKNERKKEQNKQAALRYRQRRRGETENIEDKRERLEEQNAHLKSEAEALTSKINYLKEVWNEIQAARENSKR